MRRRSVLVADADNVFRESLIKELEDAGMVGVPALTFADATARLEGFAYDGLIADVRVPGGDGLDLLDLAASRYPLLRVVITANYGSIHQAVRALKRGAVDYLIKPLPARTVVEHLTGAMRERPTDTAPGAMPSSMPFPRLLGQSHAMRQLFGTIERIAPMQSVALIQGETGTGKELVARTIHEHSTRRDHPFIAFNAAALPESLVEAELFGHVKGAFTGAVYARVGRFEAADRGTLFIDEVSSMSLAMQAKLLRVLQEKEVERVGTSRPLKIDVRVVAATNVDLATLVREGRFREDLYYRLNVVRVILPPLRERTEDIPLLARHFALTTCQVNGLPPKEFSQDVLRVLMACYWPGNVRQLQNAIESAVVMSGTDAIVPVEALPPEVLAPPVPTVDAQRLSALARIDGGTPQLTVPLPAEGGLSFSAVMSQIEREVILTYLKRANGNKRQAARMLRLSRTTLIDKLHRLGLGDQVQSIEPATAVA